MIEGPRSARALRQSMWTAQVLLTGEQQGLGLGMNSTHIWASQQPLFYSAC
jgi:hypothetical protein